MITKIKIKQALKIGKKFICKAIGHKAVLGGIGFFICLRCGSESFFNKDEWFIEWFFWPFRVFKKVQKVRAEIIKFLTQELF